MVAANNVWPDDQKLITDLAASVFESVRHVSPRRPLPDESWPRGANWLFKHAAEFIEREIKLPFWWNEPDCIPLCDGWLEYLEFEYYKTSKPFLGTLVVDKSGRGSAEFGPMINGGCLYPPDTASRFAAFDYTSNLPWDVWMSRRILSQTHNSKLIHHFFGQMGQPPTFAERHVRGEPVNTFTLEQIKPTAVVFHRNKDGTLIDLLRPKMNTTKVTKETQSFYHSGDFGDVIYSLPTVKALGGGAFYLGADNRSGMRTREQMSQERASVILPLLRAQPYITKAEHRATSMGVTVDLNDFRLEMVKGQLLDCKPGYNLARVPLHHWKLPLDLDKQPWLTAEPDQQAKVIIARSDRYQDPKFDWQRILKAYGKDVAFVGVRFEHQKFCRQFGYVRHIPTHNLLELAQIIAGCELFIGNQSCPYAIAVGLGKDNILEVCGPVSNCIFERPNVIHHFTTATTLPTLSKATVAQNKQVRICAPIDNYTGYGQMINALCDGLEFRNVQFTVNPFSFTEHLVPVSDSIKKRLVQVPFCDLLITPVLNVRERIMGGEVLLTMWESSRLPEHCVTAINAKAKAVIVPTHWGKRSFEESGVKVPVRVANLGINPAVYYERPWPASNVFKFGTAGRLAHAGIRKGVPLTIEAFKRAFPGQKDVSLTIKIFDDCKLDQNIDDPRITVVRGFLPEPDMVKWYEHLHCFVSLTKGEGWGLHIQQAMAIGRPVIAPNDSGQSEFMTEFNSYCCRFTLDPCDWGPYIGAGNWANCDVDHCAQLMRDAYSHQKESQSIGARAAKDAGRYTWSKMVDQITAILREFGKL